MYAPDGLSPLAASSRWAQGGNSCMPSGVVEEDVVLFAVPKKGRIYEDVLKILKGAGLDFKRPERLDVATCTELPVKLVFLPAHDIPSYVMLGNVDLGISGSDMLQETLLEANRVEDAPIKVLMPLGLGKCKLCLQAPVREGGNRPEDFVGKRVVTSFPHLAKKYFKDLTAGGGSPPETTIRVVSGSVEAACGLGLADAVVDLVETGTTMRAAGLEVVSDIFETEILLFEQAHDEQSARKRDTIETIVNRIRGYQTSTRFVMIVYNCHDKDLQACCQITPGKRSPTVTELKEPGWHSVSALVPKDKMNSIMDQLTKTGATDVLCLALTSTRM